MELAEALGHRLGLESEGGEGAGGGWGRGAGRCCSVVGRAGVCGGAATQPPGAAPRTDIMLGARPGRRGRGRDAPGHAAGGSRVAHGWTRALGGSARTRKYLSAPRERARGVLSGPGWK